jgi:hypothetical protein
MLRPTSARTAETPARSGGRLGLDHALSFLLFAATAAYLHYSWPRTLVGLDEGAFLYEAKRAVDGQVMYRDFFDLIGPVSVYAMALGYALFGVSMETARWSMALVHGGIVALIYASAREMGVRPILAAAVSLTHVALFYPSLTFASSHWFATLLTAVVFWIVLRGPLVRPRAAAAAGALTALVCLTLQQNGAATAAAAVVVLARDAWVARHPSAPFASTLPRQLAAFAGGMVAVVVPTLAFFVAVAGWAPVYDALVYTPLVSYRDLPYHRESGWLLLAIDAATWRRAIADLSPTLILNLMPFVIPVSAALLLWQVRGGVSAAQRRPLFVAVVFSALSIASMLYQPNAFHFAMVGAIWVTLFADLIERGVRRVERAPRAAFAAPAAALCILALQTLQMRRSLVFAWQGVAAVDTRFGRVHFRSQALADEAAAVVAALGESGARQMLAYPSDPGMYLLTDTANPTRFQLLIPGYTTAAQFAEVQQTLERERIPFVVRGFSFWGSAGDPLRDYLKEHYQRVRLPGTRAGLPSMSLLSRKSDDTPPR